MKRTSLKLVALISCAALGVIAGCARPLLSPQETRSPFDTYDSVRGQYAAQKAYDYTGREKPNLSERLNPKF
jgi:hypothetical protein